MDEKRIFEHLLDIEKNCKDPDGVVVACLVKDEKILVSSSSASDGIRHAEDLLLEKARKQNIKIDEGITLFVTLEPCSYRSPENKVKDCTSIILRAGVKNVIFAASDPEYSKDSRKRFVKAGVNYRMTNDLEITRGAVELFNNTIEIPLTSMQLPRKKKIMV